MSEYTKGPWSAIPNGHFIEIVPDGQIHTVASMVACYFDGDPSVTGTEQGTAALISAAPELFEALEAIVNDLPINRDWLNPDYENMAYAAIAKAKGES